MPKPFGYEFMLTLSDSIDRATGEILQEDAAAFDFRGQSLRRAVEREMYVWLVNDPQLEAGFAAVKRGVPVTGFDTATRADALAAARLLGRPVSRRRGSAIRAAAKVARSRIGLARGAAPAVRGPRTRRPVVFALDNPKLVDFLSPVFRRLPREKLAIVSLSRALNERLADGNVAHVPLDPLRPSAQPRAADIGAALRERRQLPALFDDLIGALRLLDPHRVVVIEGNSPYDELCNRAAAHLGLPCICLQQGWSPVPHTGFRNMSYTTVGLWGEGFEELLTPHNPGQRFAITGSPVFDDADADDGRLAEFVAGRRAAGFFTGTASPLMSSEDVDTFIGLVADTAARIPDAAVLVREHPSYPLAPVVVARLGRQPNLMFAPPREYSLREVLRNSDVVVSDYSTTMIEGAAMLRPPVVCNLTSMPRYVPDVEENGIGIEAKDPGAALVAIERLLTDDRHHQSFVPACARFRDRFFAGATSDAGERILRLIEEPSGERAIAGGGVR